MSHIYSINIIVLFVLTCILISQDGILTVTAGEKGTGVKGTPTFTMDQIMLLSKEEIASLVADAERYRLEDIHLRDFAKDKNTLESYCRDVKSRLEIGKPIIMKKCNEAIKWLGTAQLEEKEEVKEKMEEIVRLFNGILHPEQGSAVSNKRRKLP